VKDVDGVELIKVCDPTFLMHIGGKIETVSKTPLKTCTDLSSALQAWRRPRLRGYPQRLRQGVYSDHHEKHGGWVAREIEAPAYGSGVARRGAGDAAVAERSD
jgi:hypothetical protein